jgi:hypothetical protein
MSIQEETLPAGAYRKQIYKAIEDTIKRPMTENEHKYLSSILKAYVREHAPTQPINMPPMKHLWTCDACAAEKVVVGKVAEKKQVNHALRNQRKIKDSIEA